MWSVLGPTLNTHRQALMCPSHGPGPWDLLWSLLQTRTSMHTEAGCSSQSHSRCGLGLAQQRDSRARHRRRVEERRPLKPRAPRSNGSVGPDGSPRTQRWPAQLAHGPAPHGHSLTGFPREPVSAGGAAWAGRRSAPPPLPTQELAVTGQGPARPTTQLSVGCFTVPISDHGWPYVTSPPRAHTTNK